MSAEPLTGPRLSDHDFFTQAIDHDQPGLEGIPGAVARGDYATARRLFAAQARASLQPERFFTIERQFRGYNFLYEGETPAEAAERILNLELISCGVPHQFEGQVDWFSNHTHNQYKEWTWQLSRHPEWGILAEMYRQTGDERYAEGFVRFFRSWVKQALVPEDAHGGATLCWRTIEAGIRMGGVWQWALHSFYQSPHFTDDVLIDWYKSVWEHGWRLRNFHRTHNWLIMEMNGLAQIALLYPQFRDRDEWRSYAFDRLIEELESQVYPDGFQFELTTNYHQVVIRNYEWLWDVYDAYGETVPAAFGQALEKMHEVNVRLMMPDGRLPDLNDGAWLPVAPLMKGAVKRYPERSEFEWAASEGKTGSPPAESSWAFPYAGYFVMRNNWTSQAVWGFFDGGPFGFAHQHEDKLNLLVHGHGRLLLTEAGDYAYDTSEMRRYVLSTRGHNTIRVDRQDQNRRRTFNREAVRLDEPAPATWRSDATFDMAEAVYDEGYGPNAEPWVRHQRRVIFLKQPPLGLQPFFVVVDRVTVLDGQLHHLESLWHFNTDSAAVVAARSVQSQDPEQANLFLSSSPVPGLQVEVISGQEEPEWQGWKSTRNNAQGGNIPAPTAIYHWHGNDAYRQVLVLYPVPPNQDSPIKAIGAYHDPKATGFTLVLNDGRGITLDENQF